MSPITATGDDNFQGLKWFHIQKCIAVSTYHVCHKIVTANKTLFILRCFITWLECCKAETHAATVFCKLK